MNFEHVQTIDQLIRAGKTGDMSLDALSLHVVDELSGNTYLSEMVYSKYIDILNGRLLKFDYSHDEKVRYAFNPELLSMDVYGTPLLSHLILFFNNVGAHRFNKSYVYLFPKSVINGLFQKILLKEADTIRKNREKTKD